MNLNQPILSCKFQAIEDSAQPTDLLTIGRFSEMTRLSVKALRIYADMGLLLPAATSDRSGYRYYDESQAERAEAIRLLRSIEMPLEEIRKAIDGAPDASARAIAEHEQRLVSDRGRLERMLSIAAELRQGTKPLIPYEVSVKQVDPLLVASLRLRVSMTTVERQIQIGFRELLQILDPQENVAAAAPLIVFHNVIDDETEGVIELCLPVNVAFQTVGRVRASTLAGGTIAFTVHRGRHLELAPAYHALSRWMQTHGHEADGAPREIYLSTPKEVPEIDLLTEVQWPIRPPTGS